MHKAPSNRVDWTSRANAQSWEEWLSESNGQYRTNSERLSLLVDTPLISQCLQHFGKTPPRRILEYGIGTGRLLRKLRSLYQDAEICFLEINERFAEHASAQIKGVSRVTDLENPPTEFLRSTDLLVFSQGPELLNGDEWEHFVATVNSKWLSSDRATSSLMLLSLYDPERTRAEAQAIDRFQSTEFCDTSWKTGQETTFIREIRTGYLQTCWNNHLIADSHLIPMGDEAGYVIINCQKSSSRD